MVNNNRERYYSIVGCKYTKDRYPDTVYCGLLSTENVIK